MIKTTNCILVKHIQIIPAEMPCIRCGNCADVCPIKLLPQQLYWHARSDNFEQTQQYHIFDCIECGCCSYVCPSHIPLVQYYRYAKTQIAAGERKRDGADHSKQRFLQRQQRLLADKQEKPPLTEEADSMSGMADQDNQAKNSYIDAAVSRTREKRRQIQELDKDE